MSRNENARMTEASAPGDVQPATRGEFLAARQTAVRELERGIGSPLGVLLNACLVSWAAFAVMIADSAITQPRVETFNIVFAVVLVAAALVTVPFTLRRALRTRKLMAAVLAWETAERQSRSLPPGQVRPDLRTPFDARRDADFETIAMDARIAARRRANGTWLRFRLLPPSLGLLPGLLLVFGGVSRDWAPTTRVAWAVAGGYVVVSCVVAIAATLRFSAHMWKLDRTQKSDIVAWRTERLMPGEPAEVDPDWFREQALILAPLVGLSALAIVVRVMTSSPVVGDITMFVLVLAGLATLVALEIRRYRAGKQSAVHRAATRAADQRAALRAEQP
jgi:hypothetical protein